MECSPVVLQSMTLRLFQKTVDATEGMVARMLDSSLSYEREPFLSFMEGDPGNFYCKAGNQQGINYSKPWDHGALYWTEANWDSRAGIHVTQHAYCVTIKLSSAAGPILPLIK